MLGVSVSAGGRLWKLLRAAQPKLNSTMLSKNEQQAVMTRDHPLHPRNATGVEMSIMHKALQSAEFGCLKTDFETPEARLPSRL